MDKKAQEAILTKMANINKVAQFFAQKRKEEKEKLAKQASAKEAVKDAAKPEEIKKEAQLNKQAAVLKIAQRIANDRAMKAHIKEILQGIRSK